MTATVARARDFMGSSNLVSFTFILIDWGLVVGAVVLSQYILGQYTDHPFAYIAYIAAVWFIGGRMMAFSEVFGHDSVHYSLFSKRSWNYQLDFLWFVPLFECWKNYRDDHAFHHSDLLTPKDPAYRDFERWGLLKPKINYIWVWFIRPFLLFDTPYMLKSIATAFIKDSHYRNRMLIFWLPALAGFWYFEALHILALYWLVPLFWAFPALSFWSETGEHYRVPGDNTRNTFGLIEWLFVSPHSDRYHYTHHHYPNIPWFQLGRATRALFPEGTPATHGFMDLFYQVRNEKDQRIAQGEFFRPKKDRRKKAGQANSSKANSRAKGAPNREPAHSGTNPIPASWRITAPLG